ncbi:OsmC family protein [Flavobacterium solisilvae]|uniref:OsmC family peroxiredoxin n=1 Tax=Flavobacterium solisilvae TaxID=1852019 RepID=A0ABX1QWH6_9FLAO|nr:OsmC family protein [Flavobacterium solisilvae]NMH25395.1 OsmC family peroxiredoxin [Flavobacterium solisilvae]
METLLEKNIEGSIGTQKYLCTINWRNGQLIMDETTRIEGKDLGPDPYTTLLASLAGCTLSTLRMYIDRKGWDIPEIKISMNMYQINNPELETVMTRDISFSNEVDEDTKQRLLIVAEKCPVSKILKNKITIPTTL